MPTLLDTFRILASFDPPRGSLRGAPWEKYVDWAIGHGLAPLAAYNLEYRLAGAGAPEWVRERLLTLYQGSVNDNVMKLVNFKRAVDDLEGHRIALFGAGAFAEALYPHVAFRPVLELQLLVPQGDLQGLAGFLAGSQFRPDRALLAGTGATEVLSDGRTPILLYELLLGSRLAAEDAGILARAVPMKVYGPSLFRLELEDALLVLCLELAQSGFDVPAIQYVDLRELILGAPSMGGPYSRPPEATRVRERARAWRLERALAASLRLARTLFPELEAPSRALEPSLRPATLRLLDRLVVDPVEEMIRSGRAHPPASDRLRRLLTGGRRAMRPMEAQA